MAQNLMRVWGQTVNIGHLLYSPQEQKTPSLLPPCAQRDLYLCPEMMHTHSLQTQKQPWQCRALLHVMLTGADLCYFQAAQILHKYDLGSYPCKIKSQRQGPHCWLVASCSNPMMGNMQGFGFGVGKGWRRGHRHLVAQHHAAVPCLRRCGGRVTWLAMKAQNGVTGHPQQ